MFNKVYLVFDKAHLQESVRSQSEYIKRWSSHGFISERNHFHTLTTVLLLAPLTRFIEMLCLKEVSHAMNCGRTYQLSIEWKKKEIQIHYCIARTVRINSLCFQASIFPTRDTICGDKLSSFDHFLL